MSNYKKNMNLTDEQKILINKILKMNNMKTESLVEATAKSRKEDSKDQIIKRQKEILNRKIVEEKSYMKEN